MEKLTDILNEKTIEDLKSSLIFNDEFDIQETIEIIYDHGYVIVPKIDLQRIGFIKRD